MKKFVHAALCAAVFLTLCSCERTQTTHKGGYEDVFVYFGLGYNDLSPNILEDFMEIQEGILPGKERDEAFLAYIHTTKTYGDYETDTPAYLIQVYRKAGVTRLDTLKAYTANGIWSGTYPERYFSAKASSIREVLLDVEKMFPSKHYGMMVSSHGTGWLPERYLKGSESIWMAGTDAHGEVFPATKSIGVQVTGTAGRLTTYEIDIRDFAEAIPMKMDYIIFDACLMGGVEVAWQLKDKCEQIVFSPAEILRQGFKYSTLSWDLFSGAKPDLQAVANDYFDTINAQTGYMQSATVTIVDCRKLDGLARSFKTICDTHETVLSSADRYMVQPYFYDGKKYFYDLRDYARVMGATEEELRTLDTALAECVTLHRETDKFFSVKQERCCGLSCYIPINGRTDLNSYYRTLSWNDATGLVK
ncbi:MAG: clostripain-related cysteine peptidase [Candidatus Cryptobacteroides sp.]|nr:clostripain-related cysteine peptidase [Bacteroides sp.]MDY5890714.1 clostripain-related cysteine peptidase [Candidatus Cryptobacteroides sp.]